MLIGNKIEVPDKCGDFCSYYGKPANISSPCFRCPIFNCSRLTHDSEDSSPLIPPEQFNLGFAQSYVDWWGESQLPEIKEV